MFTREEFLKLMETPTSLQAWLVSTPGNKTDNITRLRISLRIFSLASFYIDQNNSKVLRNLMQGILEHLSINNDGYPKQQCLNAIIYAENHKKDKISKKLVEFFNSNFIATQIDIDYLKKTLNSDSQKLFILKQDKIARELLKETPVETTVTYCYDKILAQDLKTVSNELKNAPTNDRLLKQATAIAAALRASKKDAPPVTKTNKFWKELNPAAKTLAISLIASGIVVALGAITLGIMSIHAQHLISSMNTHLLIGAWPTLGIIVTSVFLATLIADLMFNNQHPSSAL